MNKEFAPYEPALAIKELGFDEPCFGFYTYQGQIRRYNNFDGELSDFQTLKNSNITMGDSWCTAPTFSQIFRWFREKCKLEGVIQQAEDYTWYKWTINQCNENGKKYICDWYEYKTHEEAELACLIKLIEIYEEQQRGK